jgi:hypothetical protein
VKVLLLFGILATVIIAGCVGQAPTAPGAPAVSGECFQQNGQWCLNKEGHATCFSAKDDCYAQRALDAGDMSLCDQVVDADTRSNCIGWFAGKSENKELCATLPNPDQCYYTYILGGGADPTVCELIVDGTTKSLCTQVVARR